MVLQIPEEAVIPRGEEHFVFRIDEERHARRVAVKLGRRRVGVVEILAGLAPGDQVVVEGIVRVRDGILVNVVKTRPAGN